LDKYQSSILAESFRRFEQILRTGVIFDCTLPHVRDVRAVSFTEMTDKSLVQHCRRYSPWGVAFSKSYLYNNHEADHVNYMRPERWNALMKRAHSPEDCSDVDGARVGKQDELDDELQRELCFASPFRPAYDDVNPRTKLSASGARRGASNLRSRIWPLSQCLTSRSFKTFFPTSTRR
jgi:hypothetical protein